MQKYVAQEEASRQARDIEQQDRCKAEVELLHLKISQYEALVGIDNCLSVSSINSEDLKMAKILKQELAKCLGGKRSKFNC